MKIPTTFRTLLAGMLGAIFLAFPAVMFASPASAACIGGVDFTGFSVKPPQPTADAPFAPGETRTLPEWYGWDRVPSLTEWYVENPDGVINPTGAKCSTNLDGLFTLDRFADWNNQGAAFIVGIPDSLLGAIDGITEFTIGVQESVKNFINSGPYEELYTVLLWVLIPFAIVTVAAIVFFQDSKSRNSMVKNVAGDQRYQRKSAAWKELGWIAASVALFGAIAAGGLYTVQNFVTTTANGFTTVVTQAVGNFATDANQITVDGAEPISTNICQVGDTSTPFATTTEETTALIRCQLYRIYIWTPWLSQQFNTTDAREARIDKDNVYDDNAALKKAIAQVEERFGPEAASLAPYLQLHLALGGNNEAFGEVDLTQEERFDAFYALGNTIDTNSVQTNGAGGWEEQWGTSSGRFFDSLFASTFAFIAGLFVIAALVLWISALLIGALLPIFAVVVAALIAVQRFRRFAGKIMGWWLYSLIIPVVAAFTLAVSLSIGQLLTNLISFRGGALFLFLAFETAAFIGFLYILYRAFKKKKKDDKNGGGMSSKLLNLGATAAGAAVGGTVGAAVGSKVADAATGDNTEPRPGGDAGSPIGEIESQPQPRPSAPDEEIVDAEVIYDSAWEDYGPQPVPVAVPVAAPAPRASISGPSQRLNEDLGDGDNSGPSGPSGEQTGGASSRDEQRIQDIIDEGVARIQATTQNSADYIAEGTLRAAEGLGQVTEAGTQVIQGEATRVREEIVQSADSVGKAASEAKEQVEGSTRIIRETRDEAERSVKEASESGVKAVGEETSRKTDEASNAIQEKADRVSDAAEDKIADKADLRADSLDKQADRIEENIRNEADEAEGRLIRRNT
jgi:cbb3-type cytochrome oxidase subunit 3